MGQGKYNASDIAAINGQPVGKYTDADVATGGAAAPQQTTAQPGMWDRIKSAATTGLVGGYNDDFQQRQKDRHDYVTGAPPSDFEVKHPYLSGLMRGSVGAGTDLMDMASSMTSPLSLATMGMGAAGKIPGAAGTIAKAGTTLTGGLFAAKGAKDVVENASGAADLNPDAVQKTLFGGAMAAGGTAGAMGDRDFANVPLKKSPVRLWQDASNSVMNKVLPGTPEELLVRATKPTVGLGDYEKSLTRSMPSLAAKNPDSLSTLADAADAVKNDSNAQYQNLKANSGNAPVPTYSVATKQMDSIPALDLFENPNIVGKTGLKADLYNTTMPVEQADALRVDTNAKLRSFFNKAGGDQNAALSDPATARIHAVNSGVRDELYDTLRQSNPNGPDPSSVQQAYGDAVDIGDTAARRNTVFSRQQPVSLQEGIVGPLALASPTGAVSYAATKLFKKLNNSDFQVKSAFDRYGLQQRPPVSRAIFGPSNPVKYGVFATALANASNR